LGLVGPTQGYTWMDFFLLLPLPTPAYHLLPTQGLEAQVLQFWVSLSKALGLDFTLLTYILRLLPALSCWIFYLWFTWRLNSTRSAAGLRRFISYTVRFAYNLPLPEGVSRTFLPPTRLAVYFGTSYPGVAHHRVSGRTHTCHHTSTGPASSYRRDAL